MDKRPYAVAEGARIEIDGIEYLLIIAPVKGLQPMGDDEMLRTGKMFEMLSRNQPLLLVQKRDDGGCIVMWHGPIKEKIESKNPKEFHWTTIPFFLPDDDLQR